MDAVMFVKTLVKPGAVIQGGAFRLDKGPTDAERHAFRNAVALHEGCIRDGRDTHLAVIVNDLALAPSARPKLTGGSPFPEEYVRLLQEAHIPVESIMVFYESTLRNGAQSDAKRKGVAVAMKLNGTTGMPVPICASIMGRFYSELAEAGFAQQIGFYARQPNDDALLDERADTACPLGPLKGAKESESGYQLRLEVINYFVFPDGRVGVGGHYVPKEG